MSTIKTAQLNLQSGFAMVPPAMAEGDAKDIGRRLRAIRTALGLKQNVMAARIGEADGGPQKWNNWEHGRDRIPVPSAIKVCIASGATLDYIYRGLMGGLPSDLAQRLDSTDKSVKRIRKA